MKNTIKITRRSEWTLVAVLTWARRTMLEERHAVAGLWKLGAELQLQAGILSDPVAISVDSDTLTVEASHGNDVERWENVIRVSAEQLGFEVA